MKTVNQWFAEYGESHQNPTNKLIHWICIPVIMLSLFALLWAIPVPALGWTASAQDGRVIPLINVATVFAASALLFYLRLSLTLAIGMVVESALLLYLTYLMDAYLSTPLWAIGLVLFIAAWIVQFYGHKIEGKKPSFFKDLQFLLIGPLWIMGFIYRRFGIPY
ncbi:MAG: DUF962 domain-containing protein [Bacteroidia bacterium]|nr:DUF962 domain-containing protein [Bacteroidia bacterium]